MKKYIIGIDEVGRGALGGPVVVAAFGMPEKCQVSGIKYQDGKKAKLKDSKKLSARQREEWVAYFKTRPDFLWSTASVSPEIIDKINISRAANRAALAAIRKLFTLYALSPLRCRIYLDGGLFLGSKKIQSARYRNAETVVRGDEKIPAISAASIVAKVARDAAMIRLGKKYPKYGFEIHKGYGTKAHYQALKRWGTSRVHRSTFL